MNNTQLHKCFSAIRNGDKAAFECLYNDMRIPVFTVICRITRNKDIAEDVMQELFIKLYCSPPNADIENLRAWIFKTAHNLAVDSIKKPEFHDLSENLEDEKLPIDEFIGIKLDIEKAMLMLDLDKREIVSLRLNASLKFREIASIMSLPIGTVLFRYQKAIGKLRKCLSGGNL